MTSDFLMQTQSGRVWSLEDPQPHAVHWPDVAAALAKLCRFGGHVDAGFYSVAQHCCVVCDSLPVDLRLYGLLHDAHEAYLGDWVRPLKHYLTGVDLLELEVRHVRAIHRAAGLAWPLTAVMKARIHEADLRALSTERRDLLAPARGSMHWPQADPFPYCIKPWPWVRAADEWLGRLEQYGTYSRGMEN